MRSDEEAIIVGLNSLSLFCILGLISFLVSILLIISISRIIINVLIRIRKFSFSYLYPEITYETQTKVALAELQNLKINFKMAYPSDYFFIFREPGFVKTTGQQLIDNLGGVSTWLLRSSQPQDDGSQLDTEDELDLEHVTNQSLQKYVEKEAVKTKNVKDGEERARILFEQLQEKYKHLEVTVMVTESKWIGVWNSIADCYLRKKHFNHNILIILS